MNKTWYQRLQQDAFVCVFVLKAACAEVSEPVSKAVRRSLSPHDSCDTARTLTNVRP